MATEGDIGGGSPGDIGKEISNIAGGVDDFVSLFRGKKSTVSTNNRKTLNTTTKESEIVSPEKAMALMQQILGGTQGLAQVAQGEKGAGLYNSTVNQQLTNDLLARTVAQVASLSTTKVSENTGTIDENSVNTDKKRGALEWVICTELHKQGRLSQEYYEAGWPVFARTPARVKAGYYIWAVSAVLHLRAHPQSRYSRILASVMNARAAQIAGHKSVYGYVALNGLYAICWTFSKTIARKPVLFPDVYRTLYKQP